jgi:hypothetical protein
MVYLRRFAYVDAITVHASGVHEGEGGTSVSAWANAVVLRHQQHHQQPPMPHDDECVNVTWPHNKTYVGVKLCLSACTPETAQVYDVTVDGVAVGRVAKIEDRGWTASTWVREPTLDMQQLFLRHPLFRWSRQRLHDWVMDWRDEWTDSIWGDHDCRSELDGPRRACIEKAKNQCYLLWVNCGMQCVGLSRNLAVVDVMRPWASEVPLWPRSRFWESQGTVTF